MRIEFAAGPPFGALCGLEELERRYPGTIGGTIGRDALGRIVRMTPRYPNRFERYHLLRRSMDRRLRYKALKRQLNLL